MVSIHPRNQFIEQKLNKVQPTKRRKRKWLKTVNNKAFNCFHDKILEFHHHLRLGYMRQVVNICEQFPRQYTTRFWSFQKKKKNWKLNKQSLENLSCSKAAHARQFFKLWGTETEQKSNLIGFERWSGMLNWGLIETWRASDFQQLLSA